MDRRNRLTNFISDLSKDAISYFFPGRLSIEKSLHNMLEEEEEDVDSYVRYSSTSSISDVPVDDYLAEPDPIEYELDSRTKAILDEVNAIRE